MCVTLYVRTRDGGGGGIPPSSSEADFSPGVTIEPPGEIELEKDQLDLGGGRARQAHKLVDRHRDRTEEAFDCPALFIASVRSRGGEDFRWLRHPRDR